MSIERAPDRPGGQIYRLDPSTSLRREPFGGIAYSYATCRLQVIQSRLAVEVATRLDAGATVSEVVAWLARGDASRRAAATRQVATAIEGLVTSGVLVAATDAARPARIVRSGCVRE